MPERKGQFTVTLSSRPTILGYASVVGKKEGEGPLGRYFDYIFEDTTLGEKTWEKAESALQREAFTRALDKAGMSPSQVNYLFAGDLLNQNVASTFGLREYNVPLFGQFGACSTMAQTLGMSAIFVDSGAADVCCAVTSSHFCSAERQFRFPLEYGGQRPPTSQWTATASGAAVVGMGGSGVHIAAVCGGRVTDFGITDANNMGAAMAPAAIDTMQAHFRDLRRVPSDYDLIVTGDLGMLGKTIVLDQFRRIGVDLSSVYNDCGLLIFDTKKQDVHAGGSGCGCGASVLCGYLLDKLEKRELRRLLFCATGALLSPTSSWQGESIPGVCHAVAITAEGV